MVELGLMCNEGVLKQKTSLLEKEYLEITEREKEISSSMTVIYNLKNPVPGRRLPLARLVRKQVTPAV
jgi:hypothetical protein